MNGKLWFKAKQYGWGWYPASGEGWLTLAIYVVALVLLINLTNFYSKSVSEVLVTFLIPLLGLTSCLLTIAYVKGEKPRWRWGVSAEDHLSKIAKEAPVILAEIKKANSILLHCHPSPDPDSVGSALAMKFALEQLGKKATIIRGDSEIQQAFMHFPGATEIQPKSFSEIALTDFDLFIILDTAAPDRITRLTPLTFPLSIKSIVIDHHSSNPLYGDINLVVSQASVTTILFQLFKLWNIRITPAIATNLFMGMYTDTGGFKYPPTDHRVYEIATELVKIAPDFKDTIFQMENSTTKGSVYFEAAALASVETFCNENIVMAAVSHAELVKKNITPAEAFSGSIANKLKAVVGWNVGVVMVESEPGIVKASFRTRDSKAFDVAKLTQALGGGGHRAAAGAVFNTSISEAKKLIVAKAKEIYNL